MTHTHKPHVHNVRLRILRATSADAFPPLEVEAAAPARLVDDYHVVAAAALSDEQQWTWAAELQTVVIPSHECAVRRLAANTDGWDFWLRVIGNEDEAATSDFLVSASHLPADDFEALASGYELGELDVTAVVGPRGSAQFIGVTDGVS